MKKILCLIIFLAIFCLPIYAKDKKVETDRVEYVNIPFWEKFNDDTLIDNMLKVYQNNHDLKIAMHKVNEAQRLVKMSFANELPHLAFNGDINHVFRSSDERFGNVVIPNYTETQFLFPLTLSYEVDIWGKNRLKTKSKEKQYEIMLQDEKSAYIALTSAFAGDYFNLIKIDELINLQKQLIETQKEVTVCYKTKYELGTATVNDVLAQEKALTFLKEDLNNLLEKQDILQNQMSVLLANNDFGEINRGTFEDLNFKIQIPEKINTNFLDNRPDFVKAELGLEKAGLDIRVAKREFLPNFTIVGNLGFNFYNLSQANSFLANIGVLPNMDIFAGGRKFQHLKFNKDEYKIAIEKYNKTMLVAMQETNDALYTLKSTDSKHAISQDRLNLSKKEIALAEEREKIGTADRLDLLKRKESLLATKKQEVSLKINSVIAMIGLYQALGGVDYTENL